MHKSCAGCRISDGDQSNLWIMKPACSSRGRGIVLLNDISQVSYSETVVIQVMIVFKGCSGAYLITNIVGCLWAYLISNIV